ncbi:hypothetical protein JCM8097_007642 [Rhodosporidiobolus ruineniae]
MLVQSTVALALVSSLISGAQALHQAAPAAHRLVARQETAATSTAHHATSTAAETSSTTRAAAASSTVTSIATSRKVAENAAVSALPLTQYTYAWDERPYQVNPYKSTRGPQTGFNICNSTTAGDGSLCQTLVANNMSDFCLWGAPGTGSELETIGDVEAATVAYCTTDKWGARVLKAGAITGLQILRSEYYIQLTGFIDQTALHLQADDSGGELDPHGADLLGNPLGGLVYSNGLPGGDNSTLQQVIEWNNFIGGGIFCLKLCSEKQPAGTNYCENTSDRMGCSYNMPASYKDGEFTDCDSELQDVVGVYTGTDGKVSTYSQPPEGTAPNPPYTPKIPKTSNCKTYASTELFAAATTSAASSASSGSKASGSGAKTTGSAAAASASTKSDSAESAATGGGFALFGAATAFLAVLAGGLAVLA